MKLAGKTALVTGAGQGIGRAIGLALAREGCQIGAWVGIFTHGSEHAIRLLGRQFVHVPNARRPGYTRGRVAIGPYTFVGAGSIILPGVTIGRGCLIGAGTLVARDVPDHAIVTGWPGQARGDTARLDRSAVETRRQLRHVVVRLERLLIARQPDEAHLRFREQADRSVGHAEPGPQHRHDDG